MDRDDVSTALQRLAGVARVLIYDVPEDGAPQRDNPLTPFVRGSGDWWRYIERRRVLDDGADLNLVVSMRGLRAEERLLAISWGCAYANSFLLIEPADPWLDLTTQDGIASFAEKTGENDPITLVRSAYAEWNYWVRDETGDLEGRAAVLDVSDPEATLWQTLLARLPEAFPADAFLSGLTLLNLREAELFTGGREVARAIMPFLTRLGMPVLYDARHVMQGVRQLVNAGLAWVQDPEDGWRIYRGPHDPIPPEISDERLAMMVR